MTSALHVVRALANRDYLGNSFARAMYRRRSLLACAAQGTLPREAPGALSAYGGAVTLRAI
jgi:hypothetical protein